MSTETITVRVNPEISKRLEQLAKATKRSKSFLASEAIEEYLAVQEWQVEAIMEGIREADQDKGVDFEIVKKHWEKHLEDSSD